MPNDEGAEPCTVLMLFHILSQGSRPNILGALLARPSSSPLHTRSCKRASPTVQHRSLRTLPRANTTWLGPHLLPRPPATDDPPGCQPRQPSRVTSRLHHETRQHIRNEPTIVDEGEHQPRLIRVELPLRTHPSWRTKVGNVTYCTIFRSLTFQVEGPSCVR